MIPPLQDFVQEPEGDEEAAHIDAVFTDGSRLRITDGPLGEADHVEIHHRDGGTWRIRASLNRVWAFTAVGVYCTRPGLERTCRDLISLLRQAVDEDGLAKGKRNWRAEAA